MQLKKGKVPGIYFNWNDCKAMVDGYQGAVYKSFKTIEEAEKFINGEENYCRRENHYGNEIIRRK